MDLNLLGICKAVAFLHALEDLLNSGDKLEGKDQTRDGMADSKCTV